MGSWRRDTRVAGKAVRERLEHLRNGTGMYNAAEREASEARRALERRRKRAKAKRIRRRVARDAALLELHVGRERALELAKAYWLRVGARGDV
jgi:hypothetical protein